MPQVPLLRRLHGFAEERPWIRRVPAQSAEGGVEGYRGRERPHHGDRLVADRLVRRLVRRGRAVTRPTSIHPTPPATALARRHPNAADGVGQRGGVRAYSESQRAAPAVSSVTSNDLSPNHPKETAGAGGLGRMGSPRSSSSCRRVPDRETDGIALCQLTTDTPVRLTRGRGSSYSPPDAANGHVPTWQTRGSETSPSCDGGTSHTRGPTDRLQRPLHAAIGPSLGSGSVGAATFFGGA